MILIVDSEKTPEIKTREHFSEHGFESVVVARSAQQAHDIINEKSNENEITLIVVDSELDDTNGFELCREIRKTDVGKNAYIMLLVSSVENKTAIEKARHSGASDFSVKPYQSAEFQKHLIKYAINRSVLLVEDDPVIRQMVKSLLSKMSIEIIEIDDGIKAHNLLNNMLPPSLVIMDIGLPNMNGIQLVEKIRKQSGWKKIPVVMLTGSSDVADVKKCLAAGANDYLTKPIKVDGFVDRLSRYLPDG
jgi:DNA-binding response OmpR family regulator